MLSIAASSRLKLAEPEPAAAVVAVSTVAPVDPGRGGKSTPPPTQRPSPPRIVNIAVVVDGIDIPTTHLCLRLAQA